MIQALGALARPLEALAMQQPISLPDDPENVQPAEALDQPDPPSEDLFPFPTSIPATDHSAVDDLDDSLDEALEPHGLSQREMLLEQHRERMLEQTGESPPPFQSPEIDDADLAFPGADPADVPSGGVSQREAIMQQQRDIVLKQAGIKPGRGPAARTETTKQTSSPRQGGWLTRRSAWAALVIGLSALVLSGGAVATGQTGPFDGVASAITPNAVESWLSDNVSAFRDNSEVPATTVPAVTNPASPFTPTAPVPGRIDTPATDSGPLRAQIAATNGDGVSVRSICINEARTPATLDEGSAVRIIGRGVGDCAGWSVVRAGAKTSWVEDRFLGALTP